jgi:hypothetical protein
MSRIQQPMTIRIRTEEPLLRAGAMSMLAEFPVVVTGVPEVAVILRPDCDREFLLGLRQSAWASPIAARGCVLVTGSLAASDLPVARECGVVAIVGRAMATRQVLCDAVRAACWQPQPDLEELERQRQVVEKCARQRSPLSAEEERVLFMIADGLSYAEIAANTGMSWVRAKETVRAITDRHENVDQPLVRDVPMTKD